MDIFCRGVKPFPPPALAEVCFWLRIMSDHALFIDYGIPGAEGEIKIEAQRFLAVFGDLEERFAKASDEEFPVLVAVATTAVQRFFAFKRHILHMLVECRLCGSWLYPLFVDHMSREALYFRKLLKKFAGRPMAYTVDAIVSENIFWARGVADHLKFVHGFVDPSERAAAAQAKCLGEKFDRLNLEARDLASTLWHYRPNNELVRFEQDFRGAVNEAATYATVVENMAGRCAVATVIPPLLASHIRRESEHCLAVLEMIRQCLLQGEEAPDDESEDDDDE
jgi:hypothetical protein